MWGTLTNSDDSSFFFVVNVWRVDDPLPLLFSARAMCVCDTEEEKEALKMNFIAAAALFSVLLRKTFHVFDFFFHSLLFSATLENRFCMSPNFFLDASHNFPAIKTSLFTHEKLRRRMNERENFQNKQH